MTSFERRRRQAFRHLQAARAVDYERDAEQNSVSSRSTYDPGADVPKVFVTHFVSRAGQKTACGQTGVDPHTHAGTSFAGQVTCETCKARLARRRAKKVSAPRSQGPAVPRSNEREVQFQHTFFSPALDVDVTALVDPVERTARLASVEATVSRRPFNATPDQAAKLEELAIEADDEMWGAP
jgi:hypothetical protein